MNILGKLVGALLGFLVLRNAIGLAIGLAIGHAWDQGWIGLSMRRPRNEAGALVAPLFALAGALARSDGRVTEAEIAAVERLMARMALDKPARERAIASFNRGKLADFDLAAAARELRSFCGFRVDLKLSLLDVLADVALADGALAASREEVLRRITQGLELDASLLQGILRRKQGGNAQAPRQELRTDPYAVLELTPEATDAEIRRAYRRLIALHHPDKVHARGAAPEMMRLAEARAREINAAWEEIKARRGL